MSKCQYFYINPTNLGSLTLTFTIFKSNKREHQFCNDFLFFLNLFLYFDSMFLSLHSFEFCLERMLCRGFLEIRQMVEGRAILDEFPMCVIVSFIFIFTYTIYYSMQAIIISDCRIVYSLK